MYGVWDPPGNRFSVSAGVRGRAAGRGRRWAAVTSCDGCDPPWLMQATWLAWPTWLAQGALTSNNGF